MPDTSGAVNLGDLSQEEQEAVARLAEEKSAPVGEEKQEVMTAFIVLVDPTGNPRVLAMQDERLAVQQTPTRDLIYSACSVILKDLQAEETAIAAADATAGLLQQQARAMMEQQQNAMLAAQLREGGLRG